MAPTRIAPAATAIEWELIKGDSFDLVLPVLDDADEPVLLDDWTGKAQVRRSEDDPLIHEWSTEGTGGTAMTLVNGTVVLTVDGAVTSEWATGSAHISVEITSPAPTARTHVIANGTLRALAEYTK